MIIDVVFREINQYIPVTLNETSNRFNAVFKGFQPFIELPEAYSGETVVTPSNVEQRLDTKHFYMNENIIIEPIPNNYGLITWNGSTLTVS